MKTVFIRNPAALAVVLALGIFSTAPYAQLRDPNENALLLDVRGAPVMSATGLCWHTGSGPAPSWTQGCHAAAPAPVAQYIAPIAQPIAPTATPVAAVALPVREKVAFDANVLFDSNQSALRPEGRDALDAFVVSMRGVEPGTVIAVGHADRMGSEAANQILSEERVSTVKAYLVGKGIAADRIQTSAWGETRPDSSASACQDANTARNVACMQSDRHVSLEITGTRVVQ